MAPFCDYNAGILLAAGMDSSEHSTIDANESKKVMAVMEMMASPLCKSVPNLDFDMDLFEQAIARENEAYQASLEKKTVRFAEYDQVKEIAHRNDMDQEDLDAMFMSAEEQGECRQSALNELVAVVRGQLLEDDDDQICIRGLENHMLENSQRFRESVNKLYDIVYDCQTFEDENGVQVPEEYLAGHLIEVSQASQEEAYERAAADAFEARKR